MGFNSRWSPWTDRHQKSGNPLAAAPVVDQEVADAEVLAGVDGDSIHPSAKVLHPADRGAARAVDAKPLGRVVLVPRKTKMSS